MMQHTFQGTYQKVWSSDFTGFDKWDATNVLDASTAGYTYDAHDRKKSLCIEIGPEWNRTTGFVVLGCATEDANARLKVYGYAQNGPAEVIADVSLTCGTASFGETDVTRTFGVEKFTAVHLASNAGWTTYDNPGKFSTFRFDNIGYKWLYFEPSEVTATSALFGCTMNIYIRPM